MLLIEVSPAFISLIHEIHFLSFERNNKNTPNFFNWKKVGAEFFLKKEIIMLFYLKKACCNDDKMIILITNGKESWLPFLFMVG